MDWRVFLVEIAPNVVLILGTAAGLVALLLNHRRNIAALRFGVVYADRFKYSRLLYVKLCRLRDNVEFAANAELSPNDRREKFRDVEKMMESVRRAIRQDDILYSKALAEKLDTTLETLRKHYFVLRDSLIYDRENWWKARSGMLDAIDEAKSNIKPFLRKQYGIK